MIPEAQDQEGLLPEEVVLQHAIEELTQVQARIGAHFRRAEARNRAGRFVRALTFSGRAQKWVAVSRGTGRA